MLLDTLGNKELRLLRPAVEALAKADLLVTERLAVGCGGVLLVRGAVANVAVQNDKGGAARRLRKVSSAFSIRSTSFVSPTAPFQP
jgi:hypothetical protein